MAAMDEDNPQLEPAQALDALEAFVVGHDDLAQLEERIGRFNIFDALGIVRAEIRHSQFLAWLLDPAESHGTGQLFLRAVVMDMLAKAPRELRPCSPVELDGLDLGQVELHRERDHIDILIVIDEPKLVFAIENKVDSTEHSGQLERYREVVARRYPDHKPLLVYLTRQGDEPSDESWSAYSYADLHQTLARVRRLNEGGVGEDVAAFLDHYLRMIGSRFMNDPKIDELCERIYKNHRQALDLIFERRGDPRRQFVETFAEAIAELDYQGDVSDRTSSNYRFIPREWMDVLPPINSRPQMHPNGWMFMTFAVNASLNKAYIEIVIGPTSDLEERSRLIEHIQLHGEEFGFKFGRSKTTERWTRVFKQPVAQTKSGLEPDEATLDKIRRAAPEAVSRMQRLTELLSRVFGTPTS